MRRLFASSVTLGMLVVPYLTLSSPALAEENAIQPSEQTTMVAGDTPQVTPSATDSGVLDTDTATSEPVEVAQYVAVPSSGVITVEQPTNIVVPTSQPYTESVFVEGTPVEEIMVTTPISGSTAVPYGPDGLPIMPAQTLITPSAALGTGVRDIPAAWGGSGVSCIGANCPHGMVSEIGVSAETLERTTPFSVDRLEGMSDGGVCVTYSTPFRPDEVLVVDPNQMPHLMSPDPVTGQLVPHPTRDVAVHSTQIMLVDKSIDLNTLQDNPFPVSTFVEQRTPYIMEREVGIQQPVENYPLQPSDFNRPLPATLAVSSVVMTPQGERVVSYDAQGNPVLVDVGMPVEGRILQVPGEVPVGFTSSLPAGWRGVMLGHSILILDSRGVIQDVVPVGI